MRTVPRDCTNTLSVATIVMVHMHPCFIQNMSPSAQDLVHSAIFSAMNSAVWHATLSSSSGKTHCLFVSEDLRISGLWHFV